MNVLELVSYLRKNILYDTGGQGVNWESYNSDDYDSIQLRWGNEELVSNINEAITQVYRRTNPIKDIEELEVFAGVSEYTIPTYIQNILLVKDSFSRQLKERELIDRWWDETLDTQTGDLKIFIPDLKNNTIKFSPVPSKDETLLMVIYRYPKEKLTWDDYDVSPELVEEYQLPMLWYAAFLAYSKDEVNTLDPQRAERMKSYFDREFPFTSVYSNIRKGRTSNRTIKYGGL